MSDERTCLLIGEDRLAALQGARFLVVGVGGVGSHAAEALCRAGVGHLTLVDPDVVQPSNLNRQLLATTATLGQPKVEVMAARCREIRPDVEFSALQLRYDDDTAEKILSPGYDWVLDCIDTVTFKIHLLEQCVRRGLPVVSAMGAGGRLDPTRVRVNDLGITRMDRLARVVRDELRQRGVEEGVLCVWSDEEPRKLHGDDLYDEHGRHYAAQGSISFMPALFGYTAAGVALSRLLGEEIWGLDKLVGRTWRRSQPAVGKTSKQRRKELLEQAGYGHPEREPDDRT